MRFDPNSVPVREAALHLIAQYGADAAAIATLQAAEFAAALDVVQWRYWEEILGMIETLNSADQPPPGSRLH